MFLGRGEALLRLKTELFQKFVIAMTRDEEEAILNYNKLASRLLHRNYSPRNDV